MNWVFEGWQDADIEEYIDADQDGDEEAKRRIAAVYGMAPDQIVKVHFTIPPRPTLWQRLRVWARARVIRIGD